MEGKFKEYVNGLSKIHKVSFTKPKYGESFKVDVNSSLFVVIAEMAIQRLGWLVLERRDSAIRARNDRECNGIKRWSEGITAIYEDGNVEVESESLGDEIWDKGKNSEQVKLFIYAFQDTLNSLDAQSLHELEKEVLNRKGGNEYVVPTILPKPFHSEEPSALIPIWGGLFVALLLGIVLAYLSTIKEMLVSLVFVYFASHIFFVFIKKSIEHTNFTQLKMPVLLGMISLIFFSDFCFRYLFALRFAGNEGLDFSAFADAEFSNWVFLLLSLAFSIGISGLYVVLRLNLFLAQYGVERIPVEVYNFAYHHWVNGRTENEIREELASKGWSDKKHQNQVLEALDYTQQTHEIVEAQSGNT